MNNRPSVLGDVTGRIRAKRRLKIRRWILFGICLALVACLAWVLWFSSAFVVRKVTVTGTRTLSTEEVEQVAQVPFGMQLVRLDTEPIAARVMSLKAVRQAEVNVVWPGSIEIVVTERSAVYQRVDEDRFFLVDADGVQFQQSSTRTEGLPSAVTGSVEVRLLHDVATVTAALSPELLSKVQQINAETPDSIVLDLGKDVKVIWGSADRSDLKSQVATALLKVSAKTYDVSAPENPITKR